MDKEYVLSSLDDLKTLVDDVLSMVRAGDYLLLVGGLGAGKTTFVKVLAEALGVVDFSGSPTFTVAVDYAVSGHEEIVRLWHVDLYRLDVRTVQEDVIVREVLALDEEQKTLILIEWADLLPEELWPTRGLRLEFDYGRTLNERAVRVTKLDDG